jgi:hypothetical protein
VRRVRYRRFEQRGTRENLMNCVFRSIYSRGSWEPTWKLPINSGTYKHTQQICLEADPRSAIQAIFRLWPNAQFHYCAYKCSRMVLIASQTNLFYIFRCMLHSSIRHFIFPDNIGPDLHIYIYIYFQFYRLILHMHILFLLRCIKFNTKLVHRFFLC